jgi:hypothetical protein
MSEATACPSRTLLARLFVSPELQSLYFFAIIAFEALSMLMKDVSFTVKPKKVDSLPPTNSVNSWAV